MVEIETKHSFIRKHVILTGSFDMGHREFLLRGEDCRRLLAVDCIAVIFRDTYIRNHIIHVSWKQFIDMYIRNYTIHILWKQFVVVYNVIIA